ncbi:MAG: hypothetical protein DRP66_03800 [Planctomycetota bacterium]|nr:MAG: hypothetical protein DRP66_03800 [Planctomycetota bacterium]
MKKLFLYCTVLAVGLGTAGAGTQETARPLREGSMVSAVNGKLTRTPGLDTWFFTAKVNITDGRGTIKAGEPIELLPSSTLERMTAGADQKEIYVRLWARVIRYCNRNVLIDKLPSKKFVNRKAPNKQDLDSKFLGDNLFNKNFLFPIYFVPLSNIDETEEQKDRTGDAGNSDDDSIIPAQVLKRLKPKRVVNLAKLDGMLETQGDVVLANRTGFVVIDDTAKMFTIDGLGRNVDDLHFKLLPCETLEATEKSLVDTPIVRQRFRVSGVVTVYKGQRYILLQRATRTYSHGNFAR